MSEREGVNRGAWLRLRRAPASPCGGCGRVTKTVDGVCAECWTVKDARAVAARPRREPLLDWEEDFYLILAVAVLAAVFVVYLVFRWI